MRRIAKVTTGGSTKVLDLFRGLSVVPRSILALGTSIAAGVGAGGTANAYPARIVANLATITGSTYSVVPAGVSGDKTSGMLSRLPALLTANHPAIVTIETSINDTLTTVPAVTSAQTLANLQSIVALCQQAGATPVLIGSAPWDPAWLITTGNTAYDWTSPATAVATNALVQSYAASNGITYVDLFAALYGRMGLLSDGLHPNPTGHDLWGLTIAQAVAGVTQTPKQTVVAVDTFTRADGTLGTAETGGTWTLQSGSWAVASGRASSSSASASATLSVATNDVSVSAKTPTGGGVGLIARATDASNFYVAEATATGHYMISKRVGGTLTALLDQAASPGVQAGDTIGFQVQGTHLLMLRNQVAVAGVADSTFGSGARAGMWNPAAGSYVYDDFRITS